jgi:hypothetical protein
VVRRPGRLRFVLAAVAVAALFPTAASASALVARNVESPRLEVDAAGRALVSYRLRGAARHVVVWGAVDARPPTPDVPQVKFRLDYTGGLRAFGKRLWKRFDDRCAAYDGPELPWLVAACKAPDGSYWALQSWQRTRPFHGMPPSRPEHDAWELRISHWTGELAKLEVWQDWKYSARFESLFGRFTYRGAPVTNTPRSSAGWASYVRRAYIDTFDSGYGPGWWRADVFAAHPPAGVFCAIFATNLTDRFGTNRAAGARYRVTMNGPGVTPDVMWEGPSLGPWDPNDPGKVAHEAAMNAVMASLGDRDPRCTEP